MPASKQIVLVLGAGSNVGKALSVKFSSAGYHVALASRSISEGPTPEGHFGIKVDLSDPFSLLAVFAKVKEALGGPPNTVIYNASTFSRLPDADNLFSLPVENMQKDLDVMSHSPWVAAQEAVAGFDTLPKDTKKSFIYTGNILNTSILNIPNLVTSGAGKSAAAYWVGQASMFFVKKGYKFFYADERTPEGKPMLSGADAESHAQFYLKLATEETDSIPWNATFTAGKGYVDFSQKL